MPNVEFVVGGPVQSKSGTYLPRPADEELFAACQAGEICYVLACRQIGKTSLMNATADQLNEAGVRTARIDLNRIGKIADSDRWYFSLIAELADKLGLETDIDDWWDQTTDRRTATQRFGQFLHDVILQEISEHVVIFIDEIDTTLGLDFTDDFFAAVRTIYNERAHKEDYHRLTFVLLGVATPDELIRDNSRTPFNVGRGITLRDFTREDCAPFRQELQEAYPDRGETYFDEIYHWTNGHPYLTQKLCDAVLRAEADSEPTLVERLVDQVFLSPEERSKDNNLQFVQDRISNDEYAEILLRIYQKVLQGGEVADDERSKPIMRLKLYGLVIVENGHLVVRNNLYARVFDEAWVKEMSKSIRLDLPDKYHLQRTLGQRGFVTVHLATVRRDDGNEEEVALKVLDMPPEADEEDWVQRIDRLAQKATVIAEAGHPHTVPVVETGRINDTMLYIEMIYIPGEPLRQRLKSGPLPRNEAVRIIKEIGAALTDLHNRDVYHLGVNPKDILFDRHLDPPRAMLTDFGFARFQVDEPYSQIHQNYAMLTPYYVAPEIKQQQAPTPSVDIYGLAVTFFEMLVGYLPTTWQPESEPLPKLSTAAPEVGELFDEILGKATAPDADERYQSVGDFIGALDTALEREAAKLINIAREYITVSDYDPQIALSMLKRVFDISPEHSEALRLKGKVRLREKKYHQALADYRLAYEQATERDPFSPAGRDYLAALSQVADDAWSRRAYDEAVQHYETIRHILAGKENGNIHTIVNQARNRLVEHYLREGRKAYAAGNGEGVQAAIDNLIPLGAEDEIETLKGKLVAMNVEKHYALGLNAYAEGSPPDLAEAARVLEREASALEGWEATDESQDLRHKLTHLQVQQYQKVIDAQKSAIRVEGEGNNWETIFKHYGEIDMAYQKLIELDPENQQWVDERRAMLRERARRRLTLARNAEQKPDYRAALVHYQAIKAIEETAYADLLQQSNLDLAQKIAELEEKEDYDRKYEAVQSLAESGKPTEALNQLVQDFISVGNYEHRDVAKLFWGLVYAKQHNGNLPPDWRTEPDIQEPIRFLSPEDTQVSSGSTQRVIAQMQRQIDEKRQETQTVQDKLAETEAELKAERERADRLAETVQKAEVKLAKLEKRPVESLEQELDQGEKSLVQKMRATRDEINKYVIPFVLFTAVFAGGIIAPSLQNLSLYFSPLIVIALIVLVVYFVYYLIVYYLPNRFNR